MFCSCSVKFFLTRVSSQCKVLWGHVAGADVQVDAEQDGDEQGGRGQLQEVAVNVGEVKALVHCCCHCCSTYHNGKETWRETVVLI